MLRIEEPTKPYIFKSSHSKINQDKIGVEDAIETKTNNNKNVLLLSLAGLAIAGCVFALSRKKSKTMSFDEALQKSGVTLKDGIAKVTKTEKNFTGTIQRYETKHRQETIKFIDGKVNEKIYRDSNGYELEGYFYKDGELKLHIGNIRYGNEKNFRIYKYKNGLLYIRADGSAKSNESVFELARKNMKDESFFNKP